MTDEQIIKALECCFSNKSCEGCPLDTNDADSSCLRIIRNEAVHLCLRQQAEIERLKKVSDIRLECLGRSRAKSEAYKEFAERLKEHMCSYDLPNYHYFKAVDEDTLDEVLKEMTEGK